MKRVAVFGLALAGTAAAKALVERGIEPPSKLVADLPDHTGPVESLTFVKGDAGGIAGIDDADHHVILLTGRSCDDIAKQCAADAEATMIPVHLHRVLDRVLVGRIGTKRSVGRKPEHGVGVVNRDHHGKLPSILGAKPA